MTTLFGIKNCDTVKKAFKWLTEHQLQPQLHDYRVDGLDPIWLNDMVDKFGWETLLNKKSTTWRALPEEAKADLTKNTALALLQANPTLIKRPILLSGDIALIGFNETEYRQAFGL